MKRKRNFSVKEGYHSTCLSLVVLRGHRSNDTTSVREQSVVESRNDDDDEKKERGRKGIKEGENWPSLTKRCLLGRSALRAFGCGCASIRTTVQLSPKETFHGCLCANVLVCIHMVYCMYIVAS